MATRDSASRSFFGTLGSPDRVSHQRWVICGLLFLATVIAYVDRGVIAYLEKFLEGVIPGLNSVKYGYILAAFQAAYAIGMVVAGGLTDKLGTRKAFAIAIGLWSVAAMLPGAAFSVTTFGIAMFLLGLGEAANFPACIKTVAEWFPKRERALATGIFNSGANIGNIVVPLVVPALVVLVSWRGAFVVTGGAGVVWLICWLIYYRQPELHRSVSRAELDLILSDPVEKLEKIPWSRVSPRRETGPLRSANSLPIRLVVLSFLAAALSAVDVWAEPGFGPAAAGDCVQRFDGGEYRGRVDFVEVAECRQEHERGAQDGDADLRAVCVAGFRGSVHSSSLGGGWAGGPGNRCASGMVGESVHPAFGYVSQGGGGQRDRNRGHGGSHRRGADAAGDGVHREDDEQLRAPVHYCVHCLSAGAGADSRNHAEAGAGADRIVKEGEIRA